MHTEFPGLDTRAHVDSLVAKQLEVHDSEVAARAGATFDADYFLVDGATSALDDYQGWKPEISTPRAAAMIDRLGLEEGMRTYEFGCANGGVVRALRDRGIAAYGSDISWFAVRDASTNYNGRTVTGVGDSVFHTSEVGPGDFAPESLDWVFAKDVMEHIPEKAMLGFMDQLLAAANTGVLIRVPVSAIDDEPYVIPHMELDETHVIRWSKERWVNEINESNDRVNDLSEQPRTITVEDDLVLNRDLNNVMTYEADAGIGTFVITFTE